jgi:hypothetical protein
VDRNRVSDVIDEELLAGLMLVAEHDVQTSAPAMLEFAEAAVAEAPGVVLAVFLPQQLQGSADDGIAVPGEGWQSPAWAGGFRKAARGVPEQRLFQLGLVPALRQRPGDGGRSGALK